MTLNLIPRSSAVTPLKVQSRQWSEFFSFLNNYVLEGLDLSDNGATIRMLEGKARINGLFVNVDADYIFLTEAPTNPYCHLKIVKSDNINPSGVQIAFLSSISSDRDYLFIGKVVANSAGTGFDIDLLSVPRDSGIRDDFFGDGSDGDASLTTGNTINADKQYNNLTVTGTVNVTAEVAIRVSNMFYLNGTLVRRGVVLGGAGGNGTRGTISNPIIGNGIDGISGNAYENFASSGSSGSTLDNQVSAFGIGGTRVANTNVLHRSFSIFGSIVNISSGCGGGGGGSRSPAQSFPYNGANGGGGNAVNGTNGSSLPNTTGFIQGGGGGGQGGSGAGAIRVLTKHMRYGATAIMDLRGGNGGDGGHGGIRISDGREYGGKGGIGSGGDGGIAVIFSKTETGYAENKFLIGKGLKGVVVNGYDDGNATDGSDGQVWRGLV